MAFARWDPLQDLLALQERIGRLAGLDAPGWVPPVDIYETPDRYVVTAELAGLGRADFQVQVQNGRLTLRGQRPKEAACCEQFHRVERGHGQFSRTFLLPHVIDAATVSADLDTGIVTITVPKAPPRRVEVG